MVDDDVWDDARREETVASEDKGGTNPAKYVE